jgi:hypothetical protein
MSSRRAIALIAGAATLLVGFLPAATASAANKPTAAKSVVHPNGSVALPGVVSQTPVSYTPNVSSGPWCGKACKVSTVYSTVVVNGEVIVAGVFGEVCAPAPQTYAQCPAKVQADYIFAFNPQTGAIDPNFNPTFDQPIYSLAAGPNNTVYVGGAFTQADGTPEEGVAQLVVDPGQSDDGTLAPGFDAYTNNIVYQVAYNGNALYIGGQFGETDGLKTTGLSRVNATTGALDKTFKFTLSHPDGGALQVKSMSLSPDGTMLVIAGTFMEVNGQSDPRLTLLSTGGALGTPGTLESYGVPLLSNNCSAQHNYINGVDFSPDGTYFVIADTGYTSNGQPGLCDATARFNVSSSGLSVTPDWINYAGGDSFRSVVVAGSVVYVGGHNRWLNNECGNNSACGNNTMLVNGVGAIDANTGYALPWWHPETGRGRGVQSLTIYPAGTFPGSDGGLLLGTDVTSIGGVAHDELAMFPATSTAAQTPGGAIMNGLFSQGWLGGLDESGQGTPPMCVDDQNDGTAAGSVVDLAYCNSSNEQNWTIGSDGTIQVNGLCMDTSGGATDPGTAVVLNTCDSTSSQVWTQSTGNTVINQASGLCLDDPGSSTSNGTALDINTCSGALSQSWPLPVAQASPTTAPVGPVFDDQVQSNDGVPCLTDYKALQTQGNQVQTSTCFGYAQQTWTLQSDGTIQFKGRCLDTAGSGTTSGTGVVLDKCTAVTSQVWQPASNYELVNEASGLCLTSPSTANGTQAQIQSCYDGGQQQWRLPQN